MFKNIFKMSLIMAVLFLTVGCGCTAKTKVVNEETVKGDDPGETEVYKKLTTSNNGLSYEFETDEVKVTAKSTYNGKAFTYKDGKFQKEHYSVYLELREYDYAMFDEYKDLDGYDKFTMSGKEALKTMGDTSEAIMVKITENDVLFIMGVTDGTIVNTEMTSDRDYQELVSSIVIEVTKK